MTSKVIIDLNRRTISKTSLLRNRFTPTWRARTACRDLAERCSAHDIKIGPKDDLFGPYTKNLILAGITELQIEKGTTTKEIRKTLNTLTDCGFSALARILPQQGFRPESLDTAINLADLRRDLATVDYRDTTYFNWLNMMMSGLVGFGVGACLLDLQPIIVKFISGLVGAIGYPLSLISSRLVKHASRAARFFEDSKLLDHLARGGQITNYQRLGTIVPRMDRKNLTILTRNWDFETLAWLVKHDSEVVMNNPRVWNYLKTAQSTDNAGLLTTLAANPVPAIRAAAAENTSIPEAVIGKLINEDPDQSVREAVQKNPKVVAMLALAASTTSSVVLADLARKPFPCVRRVAARNPKTPADAVAYVLSQLLKDPIEGVIRTESTNYAGPCDTPDFQITHIMGTVGYGYVRKSLEISREILKVHDVDKPLIMQRLKELNVELYDALNR